MLNDKNHPSKKDEPRNVWGTNYAFRRNFDPGYAKENRPRQPKRPTPRQKAKQAAAGMQRQTVEQQLHLEQQVTQAVDQPGPSHQQIEDPQQILMQQQLQQQFREAVQQPGTSHQPPPIPPRTYRNRTDAPDTPPNPYSAPSTSRNVDVGTRPNTDRHHLHDRPTHKTGMKMGTAMTQPRRILGHHEVNAPEWSEHRVSKPPPVPVRRTFKKQIAAPEIPDVQFYEDIENRSPIVRNTVGIFNQTENVHDPMWSATEVVVHEGLDGM